MIHPYVVYCKEIMNIPLLSVLIVEKGLDEPVKAATATVTATDQIPS